MTEKKKLFSPEIWNLKSVNNREQYRRNERLKRRKISKQREKLFQTQSALKDDTFSACYREKAVSSLLKMNPKVVSFHFSESRIDYISMDPKENKDENAGFKIQVVPQLNMKHLFNSETGTIEQGEEQKGQNGMEQLFFSGLVRKKIKKSYEEQEPLLSKEIDLKNELWNVFQEFCSAFLNKQEGAVQQFEVKKD